MSHRIGMTPRSIEHDGHVRQLECSDRAASAMRRPGSRPRLKFCNKRSRICAISISTISDYSWRNLFGRMAPTHLPKFLLLRIIAYRMQADVYGDLGKNARRTLDRLTREGAGKGGSETVTRLCQADPRGLRAGTLLMREWGGVMHHVTVVDDGFVWNGATYPSLSKVAHAITGTRWNGPRFFGMRAKQAESSSATDRWRSR